MRASPSHRHLHHCTDVTLTRRRVTANCRKGLQERPSHRSATMTHWPSKILGKTVNARFVIVTDPPWHRFHSTCHRMTCFTLECQGLLPSCTSTLRSMDAFVLLVWMTYLGLKVTMLEPHALFVCPQIDKLAASRVSASRSWRNCKTLMVCAMTAACQGVRLAEWETKRVWEPPMSHANASGPSYDQHN